MVTRDAKVDRIDAVIDEIAQRILLELEGASCTDLSDVHYAKKILHLSDMHYAKRVLQQIGTKHGSGTESEIEKRAVIKVLLFSTWLQTLFHHKILHHGADRGSRYIPFHMVGRHNKCYYGSCFWHIYVCAFVGYNKTV